MVTFRLHLQNCPVDCKILCLVVVTATRLSCRLITLPAATGVVPEANGANGVPKVSFCNDLTHYVYG
jgi:hypothetical protein